MHQRNEPDNIKGVNFWPFTAAYDQVYLYPPSTQPNQKGGCAQCTNQTSTVGTARPSTWQTLTCG